MNNITLCEHDIMHEWLNKSNECEAKTNTQANTRRNEQTNKQVNKRTNKQVNKRMNKWTSELTNKWTNRWTNHWLIERTNKRIVRLFVRSVNDSYIETNERGHKSNRLQRVYIITIHTTTNQEHVYTQLTSCIGTYCSSFPTASTRDPWRGILRLKTALNTIVIYIKHDVSTSACSVIRYTVASSSSRPQFSLKTRGSADKRI